jgi:hypothetical protein
MAVHRVEFVIFRSTGIFRPNLFWAGGSVNLSTLDMIFPALLMHLTTDDDFFATPVLLSPLIDIALNDTARSDGRQYGLFGITTKD